VNPLEKGVLGSSGLEVTRIGLGCAALGGLYGDIPEEQAEAVVARALALGLTENVELLKQSIPTDFWEELRDRHLIRDDAPAPSD